jgi:hypothetical protein
VKLVCSLLLLTAAVAASAAPPTVTPVPKAVPDKWTEVTTTPGHLLVLAAEPASKWLLVEEDGVDMQTFDSGKHAAVVAIAAGRYRLVVTGPDGAANRIVIVVGDSPPPPPPKPPEPTDALTKKVKAAYDADPAGVTDKAEASKELAELYRQVAKASADPAVVTAGDLLRKAKDTANVLIGPDQLKAARDVVKGELQKVFPADAPLTDAQRAAAAALFTKLAAIFDTLGK